MAEDRQASLFGDDGEQGTGPEDEEQAEQDRSHTCEEDNCGDPDDSGPGEGKSRKATVPAPVPAAPPPAPAKAATPPAPAARFAYPFNVRYAAEILDLTGFVDGQEYTETQIKDLLIQNGYTEFADVEPAFHRSEATNTLVITIKGSRKGGGHA